ncbi:hypothetical protein BKA65DRAFT_481274 [Rhexocercosporidium sp. MPI-PUGE-AT-0058]|nr:hypothetical protein BKA65DRAFT_481274 [Rhexocercosporidium sp. MPI-PUGE-AT-0058]
MLDNTNDEECSNEGYYNDGDTEPDYPAYILPLAQGSKYGSSILIDTKYNPVIWKSAGGKHGEYNTVELLDDDDKDEEWDRIADAGRKAWKISVAYSPEDFFEKCKEQSRIMNWMPHLIDGGITELYRHQEFTVENLKMMRIMRDAGWPRDGEGGGWDKEGAEIAVNKMHQDIADEKKALLRGVVRDKSMNEKFKEIAISGAK